MQTAELHAFYDQATEVQLLISVLHELEDRTVVDVGAEKGSFVEALLRAGAERVYAFEPYPASVAALRVRFDTNPAVHIFDTALGAQDGTVSLHVVEDKTHNIDDAYHTLVAFDETPTLRIVGDVPVRCRTLGSLLSEGVLPPRVGILRIDTERSDLAVLQGMGAFVSDVVMVEYWNDLPETVGPASYLVSDVVAHMTERGYRNFIVVKRHDQFETLQLNDAHTRPGDWGNLIFVHDAIFPRLSHLIFGAVAQAQTRLVDRAVYFADEARKRLEIIEQHHFAAILSPDASTRLAAELARREQDIARLTATASERLTLVEQANADAVRAREESEQLMRSLQEKEGVIAELAASADERLHLVEQISASAEERLRLLEQAHTSAAEARQAGEELACSLRAQEQQTAELAATAEERRRLVEQLSDEVARGRSADEKLQASLQEKDRLIADLTARAAELRSRIEQLEAEAGPARHP